jgi:hypothetical protein
MKVLELVQRVRQNHALEHAAIHLLSQQNPYRRVMGRSGLSGFFILGSVSADEVERAATEGLRRLQSGEHHLAVHPRCGTNLAVTSLLAGAAAFAATLGRPRSRLERLPLALTAATVASVLAQPLAHNIQEQVTTTPLVDGVYIAGVTRIKGGKTPLCRVKVERE